MKWLSNFFRQGGLINLLLGLTASLSPLLVGFLIYTNYSLNRIEGFAPFLYEAETYKQLLTFLLSTTLIGSLGLLYSRVQKRQEIKTVIAASKKQMLEAKIQVLMETRSSLMSTFQDFKKGRRLFSTLVRNGDDGRVMSSDELYEFIKMFQEQEISLENSSFQLNSRFEIEELIKLLEEDDYVDQVQLYNALTEELSNLAKPIREWLRKIESASVFHSGGTRYDVHLPDFMIDFTSTSGPDKTQFYEIEDCYLRITSIFARQISALDRLKDKIG